MKNTSTEIMIIEKTNDSLEPMMSSELDTKLSKLADELEDTFRKRQVWRTRTEMMFSVLDDSRHPTPASKYWQCVREQSVFYEQLVQLSFAYRKNNVAILELEEQLNRDDLSKYERMNLEIDMDSSIWSREGMQSTGVTVRSTRSMTGISVTSVVHLLICTAIANQTGPSLDYPHTTS